MIVVVGVMAMVGEVIVVVEVMAMVGEVIVVMMVMVIVGEVADSDGIYRTIREGCPFFVEVGFVLGDLLLGICAWVSFGGDLLLGICAWVSFVGIPFRGFASGFLSGNLRQIGIPCTTAEKASGRVSWGFLGKKGG